MKFLKDISPLLFLFGFALGSVLLMGYCEGRIDPYEEGMHMNYSIQCENGYVYKILDQRRGTIQVLNSDGTPLKCGEKIY
jgi:hypothetical protein